MSRLAEPLRHGAGVDHLVLDRADHRDHELRIDIVVVLADQDGGIGFASTLRFAAGVIAIVEAVDPHLRDRQHVDGFRKRNAAACVGVAGEKRLEAGLGELGLEVARRPRRSRAPGWCGRRCA